MKITWIRAALIRAIRTMAQTAVALIGTGAVGIMDVDWIQVLSASALAGVLSILTSIAGLPEVDKLEQIQNTFNGDGIGMLMEVENYEDTEDTAEQK